MRQHTINYHRSESGQAVSPLSPPWAQKWKWDALHREVRGVESYWLDSQTHAFCVSERQSAELAAHVAPLVEAALPAPSRL